MMDTKSFPGRWVANVFSQSGRDGLVILLWVSCVNWKFLNYYWSWVTDTWEFVILLSLLLYNCEDNTKSLYKSDTNKRLLSQIPKDQLLYYIVLLSTFRSLMLLGYISVVGTPTGQHLSFPHGGPTVPAPFPTLGSNPVPSPLSRNSPSAPYTLGSVSKFSILFLSYCVYVCILPHRFNSHIIRLARVVSVGPDCYPFFFFSLVLFSSTCI